MINAGAKASIGLRWLVKINRLDNSIYKGMNVASQNFQKHSILYASSKPSIKKPFNYIILGVCITSLNRLSALPTLPIFAEVTDSADAFQQESPLHCSLCSWRCSYHARWRRHVSEMQSQPVCVGKMYTLQYMKLQKPCISYDIVFSCR